MGQAVQDQPRVLIRHVAGTSFMPYFGHRSGASLAKSRARLGLASSTAPGLATSQIAHDEGPPRAR
jgi:hypothetical protein